jgi:MFS family permease
MLKLSQLIGARAAAGRAGATGPGGADGGAAGGRFARRGDASPRLVLLVVCAAVVLASLDLFIVNVALPDIAADLGVANLADVSWVLNAYAITYAALLVRLRSRTPLIHPSLFASRQFSGASAVAILFSAAFGAMLLSAVLWQQGVWHWSALRTGLAIAPGPLMVPLTSFGVTGRLAGRFGPAPVLAAGGLVFAAGEVWWALAVTVTPNYVTGLLGGMILTGIGVGLTLPTMMASGAAALPPHAFATGSAVINMLRQTGLVLGVAVLVAVLGSRATGPDSLSAFRHGWELTAAIAAAGVLPALALRKRWDARPGSG